MAKYNATLLYVGEAERARYDVCLPESGLALIYERGGVRIYAPEGVTIIPPG